MLVFGGVNICFKSDLFLDLFEVDPENHLGGAFSYPRRHDLWWIPGAVCSPFLHRGGRVKTLKKVWSEIQKWWFLYRSPLTEGYPRSCQGHFHQSLACRSLVVVNEIRWIFCMRRASWWRSIGTHTWTRCRKRSLARRGPWWGRKEWWHWILFDYICQISRARARVDACYFSYNQAEGKDIVIVYRVISKYHYLSELLSL